MKFYLGVALLFSGGCTEAKFGGPSPEAGTAFAQDAGPGCAACFASGDTSPLCAPCLVDAGPQCAPCAGSDAGCGACGSVDASSRDAAGAVDAQGAGCETCADGASCETCGDGAVGLCAACAEAGTPIGASDARDDAGAGDIAAVPEPARPLLGRYAVRARFYARDAANPLFLFTHQVLMLAQTRWEGGLKMELEICDDRGTAAAGTVTTSSRVQRPDKLPKRTYDVGFANGTFWTSGPPITIGYDPAIPAECTPGARIQAPPGRLWLDDGTCACPNPDSLPTSIDDCRVIDSDGDGQPGMSNDFTGPVDGSNNARSRDASQFLNGSIDAVERRHRAEYQKQEEYFLLRCDGSCPNSRYLFCPVALQPVHFAPLEALEAGGALNCEQVRAREATLFPAEPLQFPSGC